MLLGDAVECPLQLEEPDFYALSDVDPALAARTCEALWRELEGTDVAITAAHFPGLQFGRVLAGTGRRLFSPVGCTRHPQTRTPPRPPSTERMAPLAGREPTRSLPARHSASAVARPIPDAAPVTSATRPSKRPVPALLSGAAVRGPAMSLSLFSGATSADGPGIE